MTCSADRQGPKFRLITQVTSKIFRLEMRRGQICTRSRIHVQMTIQRTSLVSWNDLTVLIVKSLKVSLLLLSPAYTALVREHHNRGVQESTATYIYRGNRTINTKLISTRSSLDSPYITKFEQFLGAAQQGLSCKVLRMLGGCDEVQVWGVRWCQYWHHF